MINNIKYNQYNILYTIIFSLIVFLFSLSPKITGELIKFFPAIIVVYLYLLNGLLGLLPVILLFPFLLVFSPLLKLFFRFKDITYASTCLSLKEAIVAHPFITATLILPFVINILWKKLPEGEPNPLPANNPKDILLSLLEALNRNNKRIIITSGITIAIYALCQGNLVYIAAVQTWIIVAVIFGYIFFALKKLGIFFAIVPYFFIVIPLYLNEHSDHLMKAIIDILLIR